MKYKDTKCSKCRFNIEHDYGYSNYTVEGTEVICLKDVHEGFDRFYGEHVVQDSVLECKEFCEGYPTQIDVDLADCYSGTPEHQAKEYAGEEDDEEVVSLLTEYFKDIHW